MNFPRASVTEPAWGHGGVMPSNAVWNTALLTVKFITFCLNSGLESKCSMFAKQNQVRTNKFLDGIISANLGRDSVTCVPMSGIFDNSLWDNRC